MNKLKKYIFITTLLATAMAFTACGATSSQISAEQKQADIQSEIENHDPVEGQPSVEAIDIALSEQRSSLPNLIESQKTEQSRVALSPEYSHLDPKKLIPRNLFNPAMDFFVKYKSKFKNQNYIVMIDFKQKSSKRRLYILNMRSGEVTGLLVAHGKNSDSDNDGMATTFSNENGSLMSSLGAYMTAETYSGSHGFSLRLDGLQPTNSNARSRAVVMHPANYVSESDAHAGRSFGCPAVDPKYSKQLITNIKGGALIYAGLSF
jgi:hypothetical protein